MEVNLLIEQILEHDRWPSAFEQGEPIWDDEYISRHMLKAHLDESHDRASYNKKLRRHIAEEIIYQCGLAKNSKILDLGCGPGLYAKEFAKHDIHYTGIDISKQSIGYALAHRDKYQDRIDYIHADYTSHEFDKKYDCISMIWCDFGALSPDARDEMLENVANSLEVGGSFCFDVYNSASPFCNQESHWKAEESGFWQEGKYIVLERNKIYQTVNACLHMAIVASESGVRVYKIWDKRYAEDELRAVLNKAGFRGVTIETGGLSKKQDEMLGVFCHLER